MKILAIDTAGPFGAVGLLDDHEILGELGLRSRENFSGQLVPAIESLLKHTGVQFPEIDVYGVTIGPGSFTGLRVGLATIKGFAWTYGKPTVGVMSLDVLAENLRGRAGLIAPMLDAKRKRVYGAIYEWKEETLIQHTPPMDSVATELLANLSGPVTLFGSGARVFQAELEKVGGARVRFAEKGTDFPRGATVARLAKATFEWGELLDLRESEPLYLRTTEAEMSQKGSLK